MLLVQQEGREQKYIEKWKNEQVKNIIKIWIENLDKKCKEEAKVYLSLAVNHPTVVLFL